MSETPKCPACGVAWRANMCEEIQRMRRVCRNWASVSTRLEAVCGGRGDTIRRLLAEQTQLSERLDTSIRERDFLWHEIEALKAELRSRKSLVEIAAEIGIDITRCTGDYVRVHRVNHPRVSVSDCLGDRV